MQGNRCAYCESSFDHAGRHIEHFYKRSQHPEKTFQWDNLFGSCNIQTSCGSHKDKTAYDPSQLIKPDLEDPEYYFQFLTDGRITIRKKLNKYERHKAEETLRIFNLNPDHGPLRNMRKRSISIYQKTIYEILELSDQFSPQDIQDMIQIELNAISGQPFETAIKQSLFPHY
jgi:uncharacterized protein (TIGR02646 family)